MTGLIARSIDTVDEETTSTTVSLPPGSATLTASSTSINVGACGGGGLSESAVQPVGRPLMAHSRRRAHDKDPTFVDFKAGMITGIRQRLDIIGRPWSGVLYQSSAHVPHLLRSSSLTFARTRPVLGGLINEYTRAA